VRAILAPGHLPLCDDCLHLMADTPSHPTPCKAIVWWGYRRHVPALVVDGDGVRCNDHQPMSTSAAAPCGDREPWTEQSGETACKAKNCKGRTESVAGGGRKTEHPIPTLPSSRGWF
jgi:hypothetical protein